MVKAFSFQVTVMQSEILLSMKYLDLCLLMGRK